MILQPVIDDGFDPPVKDSSTQTTMQSQDCVTPKQLEQSAVQIVTTPNLKNVADSDIINETQPDIIVTIPNDNSEETNVATIKIPSLTNVLDSNSNKIETKPMSDFPDKLNTKPASEIDICENKLPVLDKLNTEPASEIDRCENKLPVLDANIENASTVKFEQKSLPQLLTVDTVGPLERDVNSCSEKETTQGDFFPTDLSDDDDDHDEPCTKMIKIRQKKTKSRKSLLKQRKIATKRANLIQAMLNLITRVEQHMKIKTIGKNTHRKKKILRKGAVIDYKVS